jgi:hypothetical protein
MVVAALCVFCFGLSLGDDSLFSQTCTMFVGLLFVLEFSTVDFVTGIYSFWSLLRFLNWQNSSEQTAQLIQTLLNYSKSAATSLERAKSLLKYDKLQQRLLQVEAELNSVIADESNRKSRIKLSREYSHLTKKVACLFLFTEKIILYL